MIENRNVHEAISSIMESMVRKGVGYLKELRNGVYRIREVLIRQ